jgi:Family of unknown function (DUF6410)
VEEEVRDGDQRCNWRMDGRDRGSVPGSGPVSASAIRPTRQIGPLGTLARAGGGVVAIVVPVLLDGFSLIEAGVALIALPLIASVTAPVIELSFRRWAPAALRSRHAICSGSGCALIAVLVIANAAIVAPTSANGNVTVWVWLGASMLVAAARGYGGCEVLAIPNLLTGRRDQIGCLLYTPIDRAEARQQRRARGGLARGVDVG